jgi:hypothetical protein
MIILKSVGNAVVANSLLHIFPNPSSDQFMIQGLQGNGKIEVCNAIGSKVLEMDYII